MHRLGIKLPLDDDGGFLEAFFHVPKLMLDVAGDVALLAGVLPPGKALHPESGRHIVMQERRIRLQGVLDGQHGRQHLIVDSDELEGLLRDVAVGGGDGRDGVPLVQRLLEGQNVCRDHARIPLQLGKINEAVLHDGEVLRRGDGPHTGKRCGFARVDGVDARVGVRATQNLAVQHPRQVKIGAVSGGTRDLIQRVVTGGSGAQHVVGASLLTRLLSRGCHRLVLLSLRSG